MSDFRFGPRPSGRKSQRQLSKDEQTYIQGWTQFYSGIGIGVYPDDIIIPERQDGFNRLIMMAKGLKEARLIEMIKTHLKSDVRSNIMPIFNAPMAGKMQNDRESTETYAIWVSDESNTDEYHAARLLQFWGKGRQTLREYLLHNYNFHLERGQPLGNEKVPVFCMGSTFSDGDGLELTPAVSWFWSGNGKETHVVYHISFPKADSCISGVMNSRVVVVSDPIF